MTVSGFDVVLPSSSAFILSTNLERNELNFNDLQAIASRKIHWQIQCGHAWWAWPENVCGTLFFKYHPTVS